MILSCISSEYDEVRSAAAFCLGSTSVGNMDFFLPLSLGALKSENGTHRYQFLSAIKEMLALHIEKAQHLQSFLDKLVSVLATYSADEDESIRNIVAECLGKLASLAPEVILPELASMATGKSKFTRWTSVTSVKHAVSSGSEAVSHMLGKFLQAHLALLSDDDLDVKRAALVSLTAIVHHRHELLQDSIHEVLPPIFKAMEFTFVRTIDLGPFKHKVDDGLDLRKAAFACMDCFLDTMSLLIDIPSFMPKLAAGLVDKDEDVKMMCHQLTCKLCKISPHDVAQHIQALLQGLEKCISKKMRDAQVGTEMERRNDIIRSALHVVKAMDSAPQIANLPVYAKTREGWFSREATIQLWQSMKLSPIESGSASRK